MGWSVQRDKKKVSKTIIVRNVIIGKTTHPSSHSKTKSDLKHYCLLQLVKMNRYESQIKWTLINVTNYRQTQRRKYFTDKNRKRITKDNRTNVKTITKDFSEIYKPYSPTLSQNIAYFIFIITRGVYCNNTPHIINYVSFRSSVYTVSHSRVIITRIGFLVTILDTCVFRFLRKIEGKLCKTERVVEESSRLWVIWTGINTGSWSKSLFMTLLKQC